MLEQQTALPHLPGHCSEASKKKCQLTYFQKVHKYQSNIITLSIPFKAQRLLYLPPALK
jgi:hypothetical protein